MACCAVFATRTLNLPAAWSARRRTGWRHRRNMHPSTLPREIIDRVTARRGRPYAFPAIDARRTALAGIDLQNALVAPGACGEVPAARGIVANINRLAEATRSAGGRVAW